MTVDEELDGILRESGPASIRMLAGAMSQRERCRTLAAAAQLHVGRLMRSLDSGVLSTLPAVRSALSAAGTVLEKLDGILDVLDDDGRPASSVAHAQVDVLPDVRMPPTLDA